MEREVDPQLVGKRLRQWRDELNLSGPDVAAQIAARLGATFDWHALRALERGVNASRHQDYRSYYNPSLVDGVAALYARDLELFGYTFEGASS